MSTPLPKLQGCMQHSYERAVSFAPPSYPSLWTAKAAICSLCLPLSLSLFLSQSSVGASWQRQVQLSLKTVREQLGVQAMHLCVQAWHFFKVPHVHHVLGMSPRHRSSYFSVIFIVAFTQSLGRLPLQTSTEDKRAAVWASDTHQNQQTQRPTACYSPKLQLKPSQGFARLPQFGLENRQDLRYPLD